MDHLNPKRTAAFLFATKWDTPNLFLIFFHWTMDLLLMVQKSGKLTTWGTGSLSHYLQGFSTTIPNSWEGDFSHQSGPSSSDSPGDPRPFGRRNGQPPSSTQWGISQLLFSWGPIKHRNAKQKHRGFLFASLKLVCFFFVELFASKNHGISEWKTWISLQSASTLEGRVKKQYNSQSWYIFGAFIHTTNRWAAAAGSHPYLCFQPSL